MESLSELSEKSLKQMIDGAALERIHGMSEKMVEALKENGISNMFTIPFDSKDPLQIYDHLKAKKKTGNLEKKWNELEYRHRVLNGLNLLTMHKRKAENKHTIDTLCPENYDVNEENGVTRLTAFIMAESGHDLKDLDNLSALEFYQNATDIWNLSKGEGLEYYNSIKAAKKKLGFSDESGTGPENPRGP